MCYNIASGIKEVNLVTRKKEKKQKKLNIYRVILLVTLLFAFVIGGAGIGFVAGAIKNMPNIENESINRYAITSNVYDKDGKLIDKLHGEENRDPIESLDEVSPHVINALLAIEDQRFYQHHGVDLYRIAGAFVANLKSGRIVQGGSTLTQQLVGLSMLDRSEKSLKRKIQEAVISLKVENDFSKDEILKYYLNRVYFGHGAYGIEAAAQTYFGKSAKDLNIQESAMLAGIIQNPYKHSPILNPEAASNRRAVVLNAMVDFGKLSQEEANKLKATPIKLAEKTLKKKDYKYQSFIDYVVEQAIDKLKLKDDETRKLYTEGYNIYTTLDQKIQSKMEEIYANPENFPTGKKDMIIQSAMVVLDPHTGEIKGLIGGRNQEGKRNFNRATQALRQPGSAFKPIVVYGPALEKGYSPATVLDDYPEAYQTFEGVWAPKNYNNRYRGLISMRTGIQWSINVVAVKMLKQIGVPEGFRFAENLGITSLVHSGKQNDMGLSIALGGLTKGVSPLELTGAYGAFANKGVYVEPFVIKKIADRNGNIIWEHKTKKRVVMSEETAYLMTSMLETVVQAGTGTKAKLADRPVAGKTGTTSDNKDAWFIGYTPDLVGAVWLGYDDPQEMSNVIGGGNDAGPIWKKVMETAHEDLPPSKFERPANIVEVAVDYKSGLLPSELTPQDFIKTELFNKNFVPTEVSNIWVKAQIDPETGQLYTPNCPSPPVTGVFLKRPQPWSSEGLPDKFKNVVPEDAHLELPEYCTLHGSATAPIRLNGEAIMHNDSSIIKAAKLTWYWPQANENTIYYIYRSPEPGFIPNANNRIAVNEEISTNNYIDNTIKPGEKYYYRVIAVDKLSNIQSPASNQVMIPGQNQTDRALKPPKLHAQAKAVNGQLQIELSWSKPHPDGEFNYYIFRSEQPGFEPSVNNQIAQYEIIKSPTYTDTDIEAGKNYYYRVIGHDVQLNRQSPLSNEVRVTIKIPDGSTSVNN
ncbi:MAG: penicillin-binding protein [Clostridia bacterium]|jgi:penicillin-binding protein 1A|nr:penicillin-binding protein [Clostridia bacterium]MDN5322682.1 penicillin-binding protein [Clostridia bacterium]